jgi:hypothetical protein
MVGDGLMMRRCAFTIATLPLSVSLAVAQLSVTSPSDSARDSGADNAFSSTASAYALNPEATQTGEDSDLTSDPTLAHAAQLLEADRPAQAVGEPPTKAHRNDPNLLLLAGLAAYRSDQVRTALDFWKQSLDLAPNPTLARVYERVRREEESDRGSEKLDGMHVALRYEVQVLPFDTARAILSALDQDYARISAQLGCSSQAQIVAIVQSRETYLRSTGAVAWSGGQYDGRIHIAWAAGTQFGTQIRRALAHELVHACLTSIPSGKVPWPTWLQEGLAQRLSASTPMRFTPEQLHQLAQDRHIPRLEDLHQDWSRLSIENARLAYKLALAAADLLYENGEAYGIQNLLDNPENLPYITAELDKKLGL